MLSTDRTASFRPFLFLAAASLLPSLAHSQTNESRYEPRPYTIDVDPAFIEETRLKASLFRPSIEVQQPEWTEGAPSSDVSEAARYWAEEYDWFSYQDELNANFSRYFTTIPGPAGAYEHDVDIHFVHEKSNQENAIPILMLHGWPSTHLEWAKVIPGLVNPDNDTQPAFHVVAPDLPGFGFSPAPGSPGLGSSELAAVFAGLMQQLGYEQYALYSTDLGYLPALRLVAEYGERILNHVTDFYIVFPNATDLARYAQNQTTREESASVHGTLPLSIAHALNDLPVGFLGWVWQILHLASDATVPLSLHEIVTQTFMMYLPGVYGNIRSYKEVGWPAYFEAERTNVPTSVTQWGFPEAPYPIENFNYVPREWIERSANITYFKRLERGAHFPAVSQPEKWLEVVREIFASGL